MVALNNMFGRTKMSFWKIGKLILSQVGEAGKAFEVSKSSARSLVEENPKF
jgi:hypothetical protein